MKQLQSIEKQKKDLTWNPASLEPVKYVTKYEVSRKERIFDPILQTFADNQKVIKWIKRHVIEEILMYTKQILYTGVESPSK